MSTPKCTECRKHQLQWEGCSHVVCPKRKSYTAVIVPNARLVADALQFGSLQDAYMKTPTNKD